MQTNLSSLWEARLPLDNMVRCNFDIHLDCMYQHSSCVAIQLAKLSGFSPIIMTASLRNKDLLTSLGATHVVDRTLSAVALKEQIGQITNVPITYIFDAVSLRETQRDAFSLLAPGGTLVIVTYPYVNGGEDDKKVRFVVGSFHFPQNRALGGKFSTALTKWLAEGAIKVRWRVWLI